jgi:hypothetical protein
MSSSPLAWLSNHIKRRERRRERYEEEEDPRKHSTIHESNIVTRFAEDYKTKANFILPAIRNTNCP